MNLLIFDGQTEKLETRLHGGNNEQLNGIITNGYAEPEKACPFFDAWHTEQLNGENYLEFVVPGNHADAQYVKEGNLAAYKDPDGDWQLFEIAKPQDIRNDVSLKEIYAEHAFLEMLDDDLIMDRRLTNETAEYALSVALTTARWQVGIVHDLGLASVTFYRENPIACIQKIIEKWGGELRFRVEIGSFGIVGRYVDILSRRGTVTGKRFESGKDLVSLDRTVDMTVCKTALHGFGRGEETGDGFGRRITFADVEWSVANGDPVDKPLGQTWVGDEGAKAKWGRDNGTRHRFGEHIDEDIEEPEELLRATWEAQQEQKDPAINYTMSVVLLEELSGHEHEKVRLGDTNVAIDHEFTPALRGEARVIEFKRNLIEPQKSEVQMGNYMQVFTTEAARLDKLADTVHNKKLTAGSPVKTDWLDGIIDAMQNEIRASGEYREAQKLDGGFLLENNDPESSAYGALYLGPGWLMIADKKDPATNDWDWRSIGTGAGFVADMMVAGTMLADRIRGGELTLGGADNGNGIFRLLNDLNETMIRMTHEGLQLSNGAKLIGNSGVTSVLSFPSGGELNGWQKLGWWGEGTSVNQSAFVFADIPENFVVTKATLYTRSMPTYHYDGWPHPNGYNHARNIKLEVINDVTDGMIDFPWSGEYSMSYGAGAGTNITQAAWGVSSWSPTGQGVKLRTADVTQWVSPGSSFAFMVYSDSAISSRYVSACNLHLIVEGYKY